MKHSIEEVFAVIDGERDYQERRWPGHKHGVAGYLTYMQDYLLEACDIISRTDNHERVLDALRKVAAIGVACQENCGVTPRKGKFVRGLVDRGTVYEAIRLEREHQAVVWPFYETEEGELEDQLTLLRHYLRVADDQWSTQTDDIKALDVLRKATAIAVRALQVYGAPERMDFHKLPEPVEEKVVAEINDGPSQLTQPQPQAAPDLIAALDMDEQQ